MTGPPPSTLTPLASVLPTDGSWHFVGPRDLRDLQNLTQSGRVNTVVFHPTDPNTFYLGAGGGGVWKTVDAGTNWFPLSDGWPALAISCIAIDNREPTTLYVGTGDPPSRGLRGIGLMVSTDGGATFHDPLAIAETVDHWISGILVDPEDSSVLLISTGGGSPPTGKLLRSADKGLSWTAVSPLDADWWDIRAGPLVLGQRRFYAIGQTVGGLPVLYTSIDHGQGWQPVQLPFGGPQPSVAIAPSQTTLDGLYVLDSGDRKIFASINGGTTWDDVTGDLPKTDGEWYQIFYTFYLDCFAVAGLDVLYFGARHIFQSVQRHSWRQLPTRHDDQHALAVAPWDSNFLLAASDGGVSSLRFDVKNNTWTLQQLNATLGVTQFYRGASSNRDPTTVLGGAQDTGVVTAQGDLEHWSTVPTGQAGDGDVCVISPTNDNLQFASPGAGLFHGIYRTADRWKTQRDITPNEQLKALGDPIPAPGPLAIDPGGHRLYWGTNYLWVWDESSQTWTPHAGDARLTTTDRGWLQSLAAAVSQGVVSVYTGARDGAVARGQSSGATWSWSLRLDAAGGSAGTIGLPVAQINCLSVNPSDVNDLVVGLNNNPSGIGLIWRCANTLAGDTRTWTVISGSGAEAVPPSPVSQIVHDPQDPSNVLYAATDVGVFQTVDGGQRWRDIILTHPGLPRVPVRDLVLTGEYLYAFTFGRGAWATSRAMSSGSCSQLQALLDHDRQLRAALDEPDTFCQSQCDSDVNCIKACLRSIPSRQKALDDAISRLTQEIFICGILLKLWKYNGNGYSGQLNLASLSGTITDTSFGFSGTLILDADPGATNIIDGSWNQMTQSLSFTRTISATRHQSYIGFVSTNPNADRVLAGTFTDDASPAGTEFGWFATP